MRNLVANILVTFILLFNFNSAIAFDFAPEVGDKAPNFQLQGFNKNIKSKKILIYLQLNYSSNLEFF